MSLLTNLTPIYFAAFILFTEATVQVVPENCKVRTCGTGTVLFNPTDVRKTCWSQEELAILTARIILEDVIPDSKLITVECNEDVDDMVHYFKEVINTIRTKTAARKRHLMLFALTDLLGGFLHHAFLPMAKKAYYSGAVDYLYMEKLIQLYEEIKWFLRTNGQGWTKPMLVDSVVRVPIIEIASITADKNKSCHKVMFYEKEPISGKTKRSTLEKGIYFPLPFFDAKVRPTAIALPLKHFALRNIESKRASYIIVKYFILAEKCLREKNAKQEMVDTFHNNLYTWIEKDVLPKLSDEKFYAAFGGILRLQDTLKASGAKLGNKPCNTEEGEEEVGAVPGVGCNSRRNKLLLIAMLVVIVAWFTIGTCFICYRMKNTKDEDKDDYPDESFIKESSSMSSKWSSSKTNITCKCPESMTSGRSQEFSSTSEYDTKKSKRRRKPKGSPCVCPSSPAIIDTQHSMKVLPPIAEMSEQSQQFSKKLGSKQSFRKISFAEASSSDGGGKVCAPPWAQTNKTIPCPILSDKSIIYSGTSLSAKSNQTSSDNPSSKDNIQERSSRDNIQERSSRDNIQERSSRDNIQERSSKDNIQGRSSKHEFGGQPLANSTMMSDSARSSIQQKSSKERFSTPMKKVSHSDTPEQYNTAEQYLFEDEESKKPTNQDTMYYSYHAEACHSSMTGDYHRPNPKSPLIFGYDFQSTSSSELSDDD
ncbi:unnamed protein product [Ceutorhynchus assimilis]|uniref:Uncharacterized protein n=1 Tax=Ceutorhynchus assimilis TaxID=467358 RepID=A0A9N9QP08_9CUCU|nr:unnamed protein product [Ceutorhynchus assimilis]